MKKILFIPLLLILSACNKGEGETLETSYIDPMTLPRVFKYSFSRNGSSNVDILTPTLLKESVSYLYSRLKRASIYNKEDYDIVFGYYNEGLYGISPRQNILTSGLYITNKASADNVIISLIDATAQIGGYSPSKTVISTRNSPASIGNTGYIGENVGDVNLSYVNEKGLALSEVFEGVLIGSLYLDKVLNYHLDESFLNDQRLRTDHLNTLLVAGHNYTELEHHWDLAYGYYTTFLKPLTQLHGIPLIKDSERILFEAFVQGRIELARYRYEAMYEQLYRIRYELSKVVTACVMNYLVGVNTLSNLKNHPQDAFFFLSKGYGLTYALQFIRKPDGQPYFERTQIESILRDMLGDNGLWDTSRLLADENTKGSLLQIANTLGKAFGVTANDLKR